MESDLLTNIAGAMAILLGGGGLGAVFSPRRAMNKELADAEHKALHARIDAQKELFGQALENIHGRLDEQNSDIKEILRRIPK
ncbi:MAG: hypothetical protein JRD89_01390 [Deltaproteobacteria bacterium]|nr:hypothetical protein [Deltaproteobacteria bacterium]